MPKTTAVPYDLRQEILRVHQLDPARSARKIAKEFGLHHKTVSRILRTGEPFVESVLETPIQPDAVLRLLRKGPRSTEELAAALSSSPESVRNSVEDMKARGAMIIQTANGLHDLADSILLEPGSGHITGTNDYWTHRFGFTTDNHLCNRNSRLDVLNAAYDHFEREGIKVAFNSGNWIDGEARFNKTELVTAPGMDHQLDYMIDKFPQRSGIETHYIAGDDHEGWFQQREGIEIGKYLQMRAEDQGRDDFKYLGYGEADVKLSFGTGSSVMRVVHPGGGSAYAISYTDQKRVESYQGGEKPQVELVGHYHKFNHGYPREVHTVQGGCTCDQSMFMRKKRLQAHVGYSIIKIKQDETGIVTRFAVEWLPFFDRGFYEKRFA
jgi:biotin operon repressor